MRLLLHICSPCCLSAQIWIEKSREQKLDYDMKTFNANKAQNGDIVTRKSPSRPLTSLSLSVPEAQAKPTPAEGAVTMSQQAAVIVIKKTAGEDSLSPFTSDDENAKPRKSICTPAGAL
jgi:hypothetical protein